MEKYLLYVADEGRTGSIRTGICTNEYFFYFHNSDKVYTAFHADW